MIFTMMVGESGSGKTTFAQKKKEQNYNNTIVISSDAIRAELWGNEADQCKPYIVFELMRSRTIDALRAGYDVIYDATNLREWRRRQLLGELNILFPQQIWSECIVMSETIETCVKRDLTRSRTVGADVIRKQFQEYEKPTEDEGWDKISYC